MVSRYEFDQDKAILAMADRIASALERIACALENAQELQEEAFFGADEDKELSRFDERYGKDKP